MHIIAHFFPFFLNFQKSEDDEKQTSGEEEGQEARAEGGVEVDEEQYLISGVVVLELSVFCFTLTVIFHVQVEVQVEFIYLSVDGVE